MARTASASALRGAGRLAELRTRRPRRSSERGSDRSGAAAPGAAESLAESPSSATTPGAANPDYTREALASFASYTGERGGARLGYLPRYSRSDSASFSDTLDAEHERLPSGPSGVGVAPTRSDPLAPTTTPPVSEVLAVATSTVADPAPSMPESPAPVAATPPAPEPVPAETDDHAPPQDDTAADSASATEGATEETHASEDTEHAGAERPARGRAAAGGPVAQALEGEELVALPLALVEQVDQPLEAPPLDQQPLQSDWSLQAPKRDELLPPKDKAAQAEQAREQAQGDASTPKQPRATDAAAQRASEEQAATLALQAWSDLARELHGEQDGLVASATGLGMHLRQAWDVNASGIQQTLELDRGALDMALEQAVAQMEGAGTLALQDFDLASRRTRAAIVAAGRSAYGLISEGNTRAADQITTVVSGLVAGHVGAFNDAVRDAQTAFDAAMLDLNTWRDQRSTHHSTERGRFLERAKNEKRQLRIPRWVDQEARQMQRRFDDKKEAWEQSRDNTSCSLSCNYSAALAAENTRMVAQSRCQVAKALTQARDTLKTQTRAGRRVLQEITQQQVQQLKVQGQATRSRINSQARSALAAQHREAQSADNGVRGATRSALPTYARSALGFGQSLRDNATKGHAVLRATAERGTSPIRQSNRESSQVLQARLQDNRARFDAGAAENRSTHDIARTTQQAEWQAFLATQQTSGAQNLHDGAAGFIEAFGTLAGTVRQAASEWARPLPARMSQFIAGKRSEADAALARLRTGPETTPTPAPGAAEPTAAAATTDCPDAAAAAPAANCGHCDTAGGAGGGAAPGADAEAAPGLNQQVTDEVAHFEARQPPDTFFAEQLTQAGTDVESALEGRANRVVGAFGGGFAGTVDETGVLAALRGMTRNQGYALDMTVYPGRHNGRWLDDDLRSQLDADSDDYRAASAYLRGDNVAGAAIELADSTGFFNDDEARIEAVMRSLSPDQLEALGRDHAGTMSDVRDALDGTDVRVFDALAAGDHALADAHRMRSAVTDARMDRDADATHRAIEQYTGSPPPGDWRAEQEQSADTRREAVVRALGGIVSDADVARGVDAGTDLRTLSATDRAVAFVTREVDVYVGGGPDGGGQMVSFDITGANHDLAEALLRHGEDSVETRAARLGVEIQRRGDPPNAVNIDRATFDPRFVGDLAHATPEQREAHRAAAAERARVMMLAAERYAGGEATPEDFRPAADVANPDAALSDAHVARARGRLIDSLSERFGANSTGAELAAGLLTDTRPSPRTAAIAMEHAMEGAGTNEDLLFRFTERMDRDEIARMREIYAERNPGHSLDAELGVYGEGWFGEVSGDDRLRMERALLGQPRNDRERLEVAAFALEQQRREASGFGAWLADGTLADEAMSSTESELQLLAGGPFTVGRRGEIEGRLGNFDGDNNYTGPDIEHFRATTGVAVDIAQTYASRIDAFADIATTGIAILGAIAAAVITVVTGGAAAPLIAAALITGLASMSANYAIKGGRYGWEQAAVDLGMTAVQAITAGVGAQLGAAAQVASKTASAANAASRTLTSLSRIFTGNPVVDQIIVGMISGSISGLGTAALDERTWEHGADDAVGWLLGGLARGALAGGATAAATNSIEALARNGAAIAERARAIATSGGLLRRAAGGALGVVGRAGEGLNTVLNSATGGGVVSSVATAGRRGLARGAIQAVGGMAGRGTELAVDRSTGRFRGDMGDALIEMGHAGLHSFVQGIGEGAGEAVGQGMHNRRLAAAAQRVNEARGEMGLPRIDGDPLAHDSPLRAAAEDLMFMEQHGRFGSDSLGRALSLEHVAQHGGMAATVVTRFPDAIVETGMRAALLRHVDPALQADFAHVPIRVLSESEFRTVTRSHSGDAVTMIENGHPVVVVREGASVARLADEGPHLVQSSDPATRERVARLDEATLSRWDELDLDTQIGLYRDKVDLEIDAHERIRGSLERELADAAASGDRNRLASVAEDMALNDGTLANLRSRAEDVAGLTPARREAMGTGREARPDFLDQPARLFSKRARGGSADEQVVNDILETMLTEIGEKRRMAARGGLVDDAYHDLPDAVRSFLRRGERMPGRSEVPHEVKAWARREARARFGRQLQEALLNPGAHNRMTQAAMEFLSDAQLRFVERHGRLPEGVEFHHLMAVADFPEFAHLAEVGTAMPTAMHREAGHGMDPTRPLEAATLIDPDALSRPIGLHNDPEGNKFNRARQSEIAEGSRSTRDVDRDLVIDFQQRVRQAERALARAETRATRRSTPEAHEKVRDARSALGAAQQHLAEVQARVAQHEQMRSALMRHLSPELQTEFADVPIRVLSDAEFTRLTRSQSGDAVTLIVDGQPVVVVREGTPPARVADEGPHLAQLRDPATAARAARLDEATLRQWDQLDLDTQIDLFRTKTELEIDAHQRIEASLRAHSPLDAAELARNSLTLHNLRQLQEQVRGLGPTERAAILADGRLRPPYLDQPARLFSKRARGERTDGVERVFEPFVGPELASPAELARRYAGAEVVAAEASHLPDAAAIQAFEALGGRFVPSRFGEGLPDASVDRVHARFPLPHEKAQEMSISVGDRPMHEVLADIQRRQTEIESLTNLAPHALRLLRAGGEIEVVFHEGSILRELAAAQKLTWTDGDGVVWRLEAVGPASTVVRAQAAPHSGFGVPDGPTAHAMTLRKVRVPPSPEERAHLAAGRGERKREERAARAAAHAERTQRRAEQERVAEARVQALREREAHIGRETETRLRDLREGRTTVDEDLRQRLAPVAASTRLRVDQLIEVILRMDATFGTSGRRIDAQEIIDSLRNRVRDGRPPRYGDLDGLVDELAVELNALAIGQMREHLLARRPDAVLGVERGGALLAEVLSRGVAGFPETAVVAKSVQPREGQPDLVQRTPLLEAEIRRRLETLGQSHFAIVDFYMGGVFAGELRSMIAAIVRDHPDATFEVVWLRETQGFERVVVRPTLQDLAQGVALTGRVVFRHGRLVIENPSPMVTLPPLAGTDPALPQLRAHDVPVDVVLGDDMPSVLTPSSTAPIRIFDRQGRVVRVIPVGTPDPVTGEPLRSTRDILLRLMQGGFTIEPDEHD